MMQTDVKAFDIPSNDGGDFMPNSVRVKGVTLTAVGGGGYFVIYWDNDYYYVEVPDFTGMVNILLPGEGIRTGDNGSAYETVGTFATVYYG